MPPLFDTFELRFLKESYAQFFIFTLLLLTFDTFKNGNI